jgi:2-amino-4-hydroxy-6-hydroxymethyldihydropteridine diphosphokinase
MWVSSSSEGSVTEQKPVRAWLSLGSNISPVENIAAALIDLEAQFGHLVVSPTYESVAVGFEGANFHNLVVGIESALEPHALARELRAIEERHGRVRGANKFSSRTLDIDLLTYGDQIIDDGVIEVPRHEILQYAFVLLPLSEVAGEERHPRTGQTYRTIWQAFDGSDQPLRRLER